MSEFKLVTRVEGGTTATDPDEVALWMETFTRCTGALAGAGVAHARQVAGLHADAAVEELRKRLEV